MFFSEEGDRLIDEIIRIVINPSLNLGLNKFLLLLAKADVHDDVVTGRVKGFDRVSIV
jgi:hypothetical protein